MAIFIFLATLFAYNFQRLHRIKKGMSVTSERLNWIKNQRNALTIINVIAGLGMVIIGITFDPKLGVLLLPIGMVSLWYVKGLGSIPPLRNIPYIKVFIIGLTWSVTTVGLPIMTFKELPDFTTVLFVLVFYFVVTQTIPFDMRDRKLDQALGIKTCAQQMSFRKSKTLIILLSLTLFVVAFSATQLNFVDEQFIVYGNAALAAIPLFIGLNQRRGEMYYSLVIESILYFPFLFYFLK